MEKTKKKRIRQYIIWILLVALVAYLAVMPMLAEADAEAAGPVASILSGTVGTGSIDTVFHGGGTLTEEASVAAEIPAGVMLTGFLVENGDTVTEGQPIAEADRISIMSAITGVQETLDHLLEQIADAADADSDGQITAQGGGRVKIVYAQAGDRVQDVMLEHGALAVLSLDGMMAVELDVKTGLSSGDSVQVMLPDGSQVTGWVEANLAGKLTVTVEDQGYAVGENVTVRTGDGEVLGSGELYVHNAWKATAYSGTVKTVKIKEEDTVSAGKAIITLSGVAVNAEMEKLRAQRQEYEALMLALFRLYQDPVIYAPCGGVVSGVEEDSIYLLGRNGEGIKLTWLANAPGNDPGAVYENYVGQITGVLEDSWTVLLNPSVQNVVDYAADTGNVDTNIENMTVAVEQRMVPVYKMVDGQWEISTAQVGDTLLFALSENGCVWAVHVEMEKTEPSEPGEEETTPSEPGTEPTVPSEPSMGETAPSEPTVPSIPSGGSSTYPGATYPSAGSAYSGFGGYTGGTAAEPAFELYELEGSTILEITPQSTMTLTMTVDEKDLSKVSVGQTAQVTLAALKGETYSATVTKVATKATNNGGSSKFAVELTLERGENMLSGMSATVSIVLRTASDVLTIPMAALEEQGSKTIVYTGYDEAAGTLTDPVTVTIGVADGENAQILSGLEAGMTYYYSYYDTLELSTEAESGGFGF